jgi:hypothetical protein
MSFGGSQPATTTSQVKYTPEQKAGIAAAMPTLMDYLKSPPTLPNMSTVLPFNPLQQQAQAGATGTAGNLSGFASGMMDASQWLNMGALSPDTNPYLKGTAEAAIRPITETLTEKALPNIRHEAYGSGFFGGSGQQNAEAMAVRDATREMGATTGKIYSDAFESGMDRMVKNLALAPQTAGLQMYPWQVLEGVGGQNYARDTAAAEELYNRQVMSQQMPYLAAKDVLSTLMGLGSGSTTTSTPASGGLGSILGGGIGGAATAGSLSSLPGLSMLGGPWGIAAGAGLGALSTIFK